MEKNQISNVIYGLECCYGLNPDKSHCKSCPYEPLEDDCDGQMVKDAIEYLKEYRNFKEGLSNSSTGVPILPAGYINPMEIKEPSRKLEEVISAFDCCRSYETCQGCPYQSDDICGDTFGNDARYYLNKYKESLKEEPGVSEEDQPMLPYQQWDVFEDRFPKSLNINRSVTVKGHKIA